MIKITKYSFIYTQNEKLKTNKIRKTTDTTDIQGKPI